MKVLSVNYDITPSYKPVTCKGDYDKVQAHIYNLTKGNVILEPWDDLEIQHKGNIVVFTEPWHCEIEVLIHGKKYILKYDFEIGFISDKGSVPGWARSYIDNDDPLFLIAFFIHDGNYSCHWLSRSFSDQLLRDMGGYRGARIGKRNIVYRIVWIAGKSAYKRERIKINREREFCKFKKIRVT